MRGASLPSLVSVLVVTVAAGSSANAAHAQGSVADPGPLKLATRLDQALAGRFPLAEVRIEVLGSGLPAWHSLTVFGRGIGIWNDERQFTLPEKEVRAALKLFKTYEFSRMPERFGGAPRGDVPGPSAVEAIRTVTLTLGDLSKQVVQVNRGEQSGPLKDLIRGLFKSCERPASGGVAASDLTDGLSKLAGGKLAPETFLLGVYCPQMRGVAGAEGEGWQIVVRGRDLEARSHTLKTGHSRPARAKLGEDELARLLGVLIQENVAAMPGNLPLEGYTDLRVSVLNQERGVQARLFASPPSEAGLQARDAFLRVREAALGLYQQAMSRPVGKGPP